MIRRILKRKGQKIKAFPRMNDDYFSADKFLSSLSSKLKRPAF